MTKIRHSYWDLFLHNLEVKIEVDMSLYVVPDPSLETLARREHDNQYRNKHKKRFNLQRKYYRLVKKLGYIPEERKMEFAELLDV